MAVAATRQPLSRTPAEPRARILLADDEVQLARNLRLLLERDGYRVETVSSGDEAIERLAKNSYDLLITDLIMPGTDGAQLMVHVNREYPATPVIVITGYGSMESAVAAIRQGAYDYLTKPFDYEIMKITIEKALERQRLKAELSKYTEQLEEKVLDRTREIEEMQVRLMRFERLAAVGELVSVIAHEVRNPLVAIGGFARRLKKGASDAVETAKLAAIIVEEVDRLEKILKSMLDFAKSSRPTLRPEDPTRLVAKSLVLFEGEIKRAGVELKVEFEPNLPEVMLDGDQIRGVILNLVLNAVQAMPRGGRLTIRTTRSGDGAAIEVEDTGLGITEDKLAHLFDPFFTTKPTGTGLGLAIAQKTIHGHGGRLEVSSQVGRGSLFKIVLPAMAR
ncbi:MAG: response regulator [Deltaproteobacteria bacterium]|nr:response regulator [Deltaproteobacteria bacterium]